MATQEILVKYKADVSDLTNQLKTVIERMDKLEAESKSSAKGVDQFTAAVDKLSNELGELPNKFKPPASAAKNFSKVAIDETNKLRTAVSTVGKDIAAGIAAGFTVTAVAQFAKASIGAFIEAEQNAEKLRFAVVNIGGEGVKAFESLIQQSERLQASLNISDDSIQQAQAALISFGLSAAQVEEVIPALADFAKLTGQDIPSAAQALGQAIQGRAGEFKKFGVDVSEANTEAENLVNIMEVMKTQAGAAAAATQTLAGQIEGAKIQVDEFQESLGGAIILYFKTFIDVIKPVIDSIIGSIKELFAVFKTGKSSALEAADGLKILKVAIEVITFPTRLLFEAVNLVIEGITLLARTVKGTAAAVVTAFNIIGETVRGVGQGIAEVFSGIANFDGSQITAGLTNLKTPVADAAKQIADAFNNAFKIDISEEVEKQTEAAIENTNKLLTRLEVQKKETQELIDLQKKLANDNTVNGRSNLKIINDELEARKKLNDAVSKDREEALKKRQEAEEKAWEEFKKELERQQDELLGIINTTEQRLKDEAALFEFRIRFTASLEGEEAAFEQARQELFNVFQTESLQADVTSNTVEEANAKKQKAYEEYIAALTKLVGDFAIFEQKEVKQTQETVVADWINSNQEIIDASAQLVSDLTALFSQLTENQLIDLRKTTDAKLEALDIEQKAIDDQLDKRRISETEAERKTEELAKKREATEAQAAKKERELKKKQFNLDKANALIQITINTAQAVSRAYADAGPIAGIPLAALMAAAGIAQAAVVASQANPYKKGTKSAKKGLALVDEEGTEAILRGKGRLTTLERGDKVLTAPKTKTYGEVLDAMMDNRFEKYVMQKYVAPQLEKQRKISQAKDKQDFAENITKSMVINNMSDGESGFHLKKIRQGGLTIRNAQEIGHVIAKELKQDPYR